jgi:hypothetical protein
MKPLIEVYLFVGHVCNISTTALNNPFRSTRECILHHLLPEMKRINDLESTPHRVMI